MSSIGNEKLPALALQHIAYVHSCKCIANKMGMRIPMKFEYMDTTPSTGPG